MGIICGVLAVVGTLLLVAKQYSAAAVVWFLAGLFGWGEIVRSS